ncbi:PepSY-associated TM helix domain-containing protein [Albibacterium sp.]|uniref:PepSY-associated TM helix domain-containing protein n=1 Tax=Albibacterium sp. TaxID=2952885 RepID=UPI002C9FE9EC|nr:PepSY-associated TM helix domain-containing protein [Albibacterium sp.]HUH19196.1 PepSY-associated TM helix domain-containing protein [Albibacterium sp.]
MRKIKNKSNWEIIRKLFNDVHLWVGLIAGIFVFVICLSGTIYVYNTEIREFASSHLHEVTPESKKIDIEQLSEIVKVESNAKVTGFTIPADESKSYQINTRQEGDNSRGGVTYYINPYTGAILGNSKEESKVATFMGSMFSLHRWLMLDKVETPIIGDLPNRTLGSYISGTMTILFTIGLLTGMVIWFPRKIKRWRQGLTIKFNSNWKRINHDIHNSLSLYSFIFLLIMGITGPQWSFEWYRTGLRKALGTYQEAPSRGPAGGNSKADAPKEAAENASQATITLLPISTYLETVNASFPYEGDIRVTIPTEDEDIISISKYKAGFFAPAAANQIKLKVQDASVQETMIFKDKPFNERVSSSIKALHVGDVYGQFSKLIYFITCLIATSLPVTGTLIWINKLKKKKKGKGKVSRKPALAMRESI